MRVVTSHQGFTRAFSIRVFVTRNVVPTLIIGIDLQSLDGEIEDGELHFAGNEGSKTDWLRRSKVVLQIKVEEIRRVLF